MTEFEDLNAATLAALDKGDLSVFRHIERKLEWKHRRSTLGWIAALTSPIWAFGLYTAIDNYFAKKPFNDSYFQTAEAKDSFYDLIGYINDKFEDEDSWGLTIPSVGSLRDYALDTFTPDNKITIQDVKQAREKFDGLTQLLEADKTIEGKSNLSDIIATLGVLALFQDHQADASPQTPPNLTENEASYDPSRDINPRRHDSLVRRVSNYNHRRYTGI